MREEILTDLNQLFSGVLGRAVALEEQFAAADVEGWDSLAHFQLMAATERKFGFRFQPHEMAGMKNIGDLVSLVEAKRVQ